MSVRSRRTILLGATALYLPLALYFLFLFAFTYPSYNGYPVCDPVIQPWCEYSPWVTVRWSVGTAAGVCALPSLIVAYALRKRIRSWWVWAVAAPLLAATGISFLATL